MISRRLFLKGGLLLFAGLAVPQAMANANPPAQPPPPGGSSVGRGAAVPVRNVAHPSLDPSLITKYAENLIVPPPMPKSRVIVDKDGKDVDFYEIAVRQFTQQILPTGMPGTTVWSYGPAGSSRVSNDGFNYPAFTIEGVAGRPVRVRWVNQLTQKATRILPGGGIEIIDSFLPHLLPVDQTLHWAYPGGGPGNTDMKPILTEPLGSYYGPVPMVPHVHGAHTSSESDGYASAWWLPDAQDIPGGYATHGMEYERYKAEFEQHHNVGPADDWQWRAGSAVFQYPNEQRAGTIWYHDHSLGMTRLNVYAGPAGFFLVRSNSDQYDGLPLAATPSGPRGVLPGPAPQPGDSPFQAGRYEIPIAIQDRSFNQDGSLFYPDSRAFFDEFAGPYRPAGGSDISPIWNPEFFGECIVVNGRTWPVMHVEPRRYRFRFLNGCQARALLLKLARNPSAPRPVGPDPDVPFWVIGTEGGFLPDHAVALDSLLAMPAERFDVIIDFGKAKTAGVNNLYLINEGPDEPFGGMGQPPADVDSTGQVMKFAIDLPLNGTDDSTDPAVPGALVLPPISHFQGSLDEVVRPLSLNEMDSEVLYLTDPLTGDLILDPITNEPMPVGPREAILGTVEFNGNVPVPMPMEFMGSVSEVIRVGSVEVWELYNFTMDAHPIHIHQVMLEMVNRQEFDAATGALGALTGPETWETGWKDTFIAYPGTVTRVRMRFDITGRYVWHCHIVEHEDNEMMRPLEVVHRYNFPLISK